MRAMSADMLRHRRSFFGKPCPCASSNPGLLPAVKWKSEAMIDPVPVALQGCLVYRSYRTGENGRGCRTNCSPIDRRGSMIREETDSFCGSESSRLHLSKQNFGRGCHLWKGEKVKGLVRRLIKGMLWMIASSAVCVGFCDRADARGATFFEDFEDGTADGFTEVGGTWRIAGGRYQQFIEEPPGPYWSWVDAGALREYTIEVECIPLSGMETKVIYAHADSSESYRIDLWLGGSRLTMPRWGEEWPSRYFMAEGLQLAYGQRCHVKIEVGLTGVKVWVNDMLHQEQRWAERVPLGDGKVGVGTGNGSSSFDNLKVCAGAPGATLSSFSAVEVGPGEEGGMRLSWKNLGRDFEYTVEFCDSLESLYNGEFSPVPPVDQWPTSSTTWTDTSIAGARMRFYRVRGVFEEHPTWKRPDPALINLTAEPERADPGNRVLLNAVVANLGLGDTESVRVVFFVDNEEVDREEIGPLGPSEEVEVGGNWEATRPGSHAVVAQLEVGEEPRIESSFENNRRSVTVRVSGEEQPLSDLEFGEADFDSLQLEPGGEYEIPITVRNPSFGHIDNVPVTFYLDGEWISDDVIDTLPPGGRQELHVPWSEVTSGDHILVMEMELPDLFTDREFQLVKAWHVPVAEVTLLCEPGTPHRWSSMGPRIVNDGSGGRLHNIAFHPTNANILYVSTPKGGIWKTTNAGGSWAPLGDKLASMAGSALAVDPQHPEIVYYGTGFAEYGGGVGIYKSNDGGGHWHLFATSAIAGGVNRLAVRYPGAGQVMIYAATNRGVLRYKSGDPWATTSTSAEWAVIKTGAIQDMAVHPTDDSIVYAAVFDGWVQKQTYGFVTKNLRLMDGLYRTTNGETATGNADWTRLENGLPYVQGTSLRVDIQRGDPKVLYASMTFPYGFDPIEPKLTLGIFRSKDGGDSWSMVRGYHASDLSGALYNPFVRVHPTNSDVVYFGGVELYKEDITSATWDPEQVKGIHADQHELQFDPRSTTQYYALNDGGIWLCTVKGTGDTCVNRNYELRNFELYDFDSSRTSNSLMLAGTQDNGTILYEGSPDWRVVRGGDGYHSLIAPTDNKVMYSQHQFLESTQRWEDSQGKWVWANNGLPKGMPWYTGSAWITSHPNSALTVLSQGDQVHATTDGGQNWTKRGPTGKVFTDKGESKVNYITRVLVQPNTFTWIAGTTKGQIWRTSTGGSPWTLLFEHPYWQNAPITSMSFSAKDSKVLYVTFGIGGDKSYTRIWRFTLNPGPPESWSPSNITDNFPLNRTPRVICGDAHRADVAYVGTEKGIFRWDETKPTYESWQPYNDCLPLVIVNDLLVDNTSNELRAATQGRGAWKVITGP
jgi:photosystem II stability/assembly factor-like uncharacterized protein